MAILKSLPLPSVYFRLKVLRQAVFVSGLSGTYKNSPAVHLTDRHPVPSWALRLVGWGNLEHKAGGWPTETTTSLLCYNEFAFCLISDDLYHTSLARPLPLAPDSLTLPGLGAPRSRCRTLPRRTCGAKWVVTAGDSEDQMLVELSESDTADLEDTCDPLLMVPTKGGFLIQTTDLGILIFVRSTQSLVVPKPLGEAVESGIQQVFEK